MQNELQFLLNQRGQETTRFCRDQRLDRLKKIAELAGLLTWDIPIISITGTNGKGSTACALRTIYQAAGYRMGVFTSPHLLHVNERIAINHQWISDAELITALRYILALDGDAELSYFELLTLVALFHFRQHQVDGLILEVGLGGRLDAINILDADVVIVTSVDLDHQDVLGYGIEAIAREKAGLFRPEQIVIFADQHCPQTIEQQAQLLDVGLYVLHRDYHIDRQEQGWILKFGAQCWNFECFPQLHLQSMGAAIMATQMLQAALPITKVAWCQAVEQAFIPGRQQYVQAEVPIILDVAHNPHAVNLLLNYLQTLVITGRVHVIFSALRDKDCKQMLWLINKLSPIWYTCALESERSHTRESLALLFMEQQQQFSFFESPGDAYWSAKSQAVPGDLIVVVGSFLLVGAVMAVLQREGIDVI